MTYTVASATNSGEYCNSRIADGGVILASTPCPRQQRLTRWDLIPKSGGETDRWHFIICTYMHHRPRPVVSCEATRRNEAPLSPDRLGMGTENVPTTFTNMRPWPTVRAVNM